MTYNMSLDCGSHMYGRHCNISCVPPTETDHYRCTRDGKVCNKGWLAPDCLVPNCKNNCGKHGTCISPGVCECEKGWFGQSCSQCEKKPGCKNGYCEGTPGTCKCEIGYRGMFCDRHISSECNLEHCVNGKCAFIDRTKVCYCNPGFHGKFCNETVSSSFFFQYFLVLNVSLFGFPDCFSFRSPEEYLYSFSTIFYQLGYCNHRAHLQPSDSDVLVGLEETFGVQFDAGHDEDFTSF